MASGHRKRKAAIVRLYTLNPIGETNIPASEAGNTANQNNIFNLGVYASGGYAPPFTQGQATRLSDVVSNVDGVWSSVAVNGASGISGGETTFLIPTTTKHYNMPKPGTANQAIALSVPGVAPSNVGGIIIYSTDGPQANYSPYYISDGINNTSSISFTSTITGAFPGSSKINIYLAGAVNSSSNPALGSNEVRIYTGSVSSIGNGTAAEFSSYLVLTSSDKIYMSAAKNISGLLPNTTNVIRVVFSSSYSQTSSSVTSPGWFVYITGSN